MISLQLSLVGAVAPSAMAAALVQSAHDGAAESAEDSYLGQVVLTCVLFLIENAFGISVAVTMLLLFCGLTRLFVSDTDDARPSDAAQCASSPAVDEPRPRWEVLRVLNYFVITLFVSSITYVIVNYRAIAHSEGGSNDSLFPLLVIWSVCMAYFFGFFGISFLDKNAMARSPSSFGLGHLDQQLSQQQRAAAAAAAAAASSDVPLKAHRGSVSPRQSPNLMCAKEAPATATCSAAAPAAAAALPPAPALRAAPTAFSTGATTVSSAVTQPKQQPCEQQQVPSSLMSDEQLVACLETGKLKDHQLEATLGDHARAVAVRRAFFERRTGVTLAALPHANYDYSRVFGANCEIVCGYVPIPVGVVGPLLLNGREVYVPMATTEGCLVASTNRGCKAITQGGGARAAVLRDGITRAPCLRMPDAMSAAALKLWVEDASNWDALKGAFESTTNFGKLKEAKATVAGRNVYLRLVCFSGDAMGMNMVSKGCLAVVELLEQSFPQLELIAISGNMCTDKKPAAVNWIEGRGKSVVCEARIPGKYVETTLKTSARAMVETNIQKNLVGSAMAGALGGFNAHASNVVTAVFLATGQDPAQNVESSTCITLMEETSEGDLIVSVTMPSIEVGTVGGGTSLPAQSACLDVVGCRGASKAPQAPGANAQQLSLVVAASVLAGELSLVAALASNQLVRAHMQHNRKKA